MRARLVSLALLATPACAGDGAPHALEGQWVNASGSVAVIEVGTDGRLSGRYCSELGQVESGSCHPLTGWVAGDVAGFAVRFEPPGSITTWSGQIGEDADGPYLRTLWHLSRDVPNEDEPDRLWESTISGFAVFRPRPGSASAR